MKICYHLLNMLKILASTLRHDLFDIPPSKWMIMVNDNNHPKSKKSIRQKGGENDRCRNQEITRPPLLYLWQNHR